MRAVVVMAFVCVPAFSQPTAVFTYDVKTAEWPAGPEGLAQRLFEEWARRCKAVPGGALTVLECPPSLEIDDPESVRIETRLALFRDLDETLHLAGCPDLEELERSRRRAAAARRREPEQAKLLLEDAAKSKELCAEIEPGQTFSAQIAGDRLLAVTRGRQLAFTLFRSEPKPREISTPYTPPPTKGSLPHAGPPTQRAAEPNPAPEPNWDPARIKPPLAEATPAKTSQRAPAPAKTSLRTASAQLVCSRGAAQVYVDGAALGATPLRVPLIAGRHSIEARLNGRALSSSEIEVEAGERLKLDVCRPK